MKGGLLASLAAHGLAALLVVILVIPRQINTPPEMEVELATGTPAPPPAPAGPPPTPEPQSPEPPMPAAEPPALPATEAPPAVPPPLPVEPDAPPAPTPPRPPTPPTPSAQPPAPALPPAPARPPVPKPQAAPSAPPAVRLADGITSTRIEDNPYNPEYGCKNLQNLGPDYPVGARRRGATGAPKLRVHLDSNGRAFLVEILQPSGHRDLDEAARSSLLTWRCLPSTLDGKRVPDMFDIKIHFTLE